VLGGTFDNLDVREETMLAIVLLVISSLVIVGVVLWMVRTKANAAEKLWGMLCLLPTGWIVLFYAFVVRAYLSLGHWPAPYQPDPKDLAFNLHHLAIWLSFPVIVASAVVFGIVVVLHGRKYGHNPWRWIMAMGYIVTLLVICTDPGHFLEWFVD
jgi:hypothetical protein